jgi:outer membrane protein assembly factor BamB
VPQVIFPGGDGWLYSFKADRGKDGKPELLWKFDANPKETKWILGGRGTRNNIIGTPVIYNDLVYVAVGQDPEHGEGQGHLWCIDPTKRGDVSPELAMKIEGNERKPIPHRRLQAVDPEEGEVAVANPNSAVVWHFDVYDRDGDGEIDFEETMHRTCGTVAIKDDILYIADFSGLFHCIDAKTGKVHWAYDMLAASWGSPLIVDGYVYIGDEDGDLAIFKHSSDPEAAEPIAEINMGNSVYSTPVVANGVMFISNKTHLFAIAEMATALPVTGGPYAFARRALGPWGGYVTGLAVTFEYVTTSGRRLTVRWGRRSEIQLYGSRDADAFMNEDVFPLDTPQVEQSVDAIGSLLALLNPDLPLERARVDGRYVREAAAG